MKDPLPFDHRPDPVLRDALRRALDPGQEGAGHAAFVARVLARAEHVRVVSWDGVLARWARAGVAAALVVGAGLAAVVTTALAIVSAASARLRRERFTRWQSGVPHGPGLLIATWLVGSVPRNRGGGGHERMTRSRHVGGLFRAGERTVEGSGR